MQLVQSSKYPGQLVIGVRVLSIRALSSPIPINSKIWEGPMVLEATVGTRRDMNTFRSVVKLPRQCI